MFSCFWATGDSKVFKWKTGSAVGGARPSQQVQSVCITHLGKPLEMWKMLNVLGSKHFIAVRHNWSVKTFMNLTFNYTLRFCILKSQNVPKSPQITPETKIMHLGHVSLLGLAKQLFLTFPLPSPKKGNPPYFKWPYGCRFSFQKWKKNISEHVVN